MIKIGNAPVSYGAFEVTVGIREGVPSAEQVLDAVAEAGYDGIDLGPLGYLGTDAGLAEALGSRGLLLAGGYVEIDVTTEESPGTGLRELAGVCDQFDAVRSDVGVSLRPRPTVAIIGSPVSASGETSDQRWSRIERVVGDVVRYCGHRGYEAVLHNEVGTQLSSQDEVIRVLQNTEAALCLDTGHLVAAGGDPLAILASWRDRVTHVHLKDALPAPDGQPYTEAMQLWEGDAFCPLGAGQGQVDQVLAALRTADYQGWILVEQDVLPRDPAAYLVAAEQQAANREYLRSRGF